MFSKFFRLVLLLHALYVILTALWAIVDIHSFMLVTGPKTDTWLVKTVSMVLLPQGYLIGMAYYRNTFNVQLCIMCLLLCAGLAIIDVYYVLNGTISPIYLGDAAVEVILIIVYLIWLLRNKSIAEVK